MRVVPRGWRKNIGWVFISSEFSKASEFSLDCSESIENAKDAGALPEHSIVTVKCVATKNLTVRFDSLRQGNPSARKFISKQPAASVLENMVTIISFTGWCWARLKPH